MIVTAQLLLTRAAVLAGGVIEGPEPEDVKAGWTAFGLFLLLVLAVVVLGKSLVTQLRKAQRAADEGVYDGPGPGPGGASDDGSGPPPTRGSDTPNGDHPAH